MFNLARAFSNCSATSAMTAAAAGLFVGVIAPLTGGLPKAYELREFQAGLTAYMNGETSAPSLEPAFYPNRPHAPAVLASTNTDEGYYFISTRAEPEDLQTADLAQFAPIDAAPPEGAFVEAMQVLDEPIEAPLETADVTEQEPLQAEEIIVTLDPDEVKGVES